MNQGPAEAVADGEAEFGLTQISEILPYAGAELVGQPPSEVQPATAYEAAIGAGTSRADARRRAADQIDHRTGRRTRVQSAKGPGPAG